jgi:isoamylase
VTLPPLESDHAWHRAIDTSLGSGEDFAQPGQEVEIDPSDHYIADPRNTILLLCQQPRAARR